MTGRQKSSVEDQGKLSQWSSTVVTAGDVVINGTPGGYVAVFAAIGGRVGTVVNAAEALPLVTKKGGMLYVFALRKRDTLTTPTLLLLTSGMLGLALPGCRT